MVLSFVDLPFNLPQQIEDMFERGSVSENHLGSHFIVVTFKLDKTRVRRRKPKTSRDGQGLRIKY
jgi:hypothetical protein